MGVSGSHGGAKQQRRVFVVAWSCWEPLRAIASHWESLGLLGAVALSSTNHLGQRRVVVEPEHLGRRHDGKRLDVGGVRLRRAVGRHLVRARGRDVETLLTW